MSKSDTFENDVLLLIFNNTNIALVGDTTGLRGSASAGSLYLSLHTADPAEGGTQSTNEVTYTSYARVPVARTSAGFVVTGNQAALAAAVDFPAGTGGSGVATHVGIGASSSGAGKLLYKGALTPNITCGAGITPRVNAGVVVTED